MTLHDQQLNSMTFHAWKMILLNFMTFQVFHDLREPCKNFKISSGFTPKLTYHDISYAQPH